MTAVVDDEILHDFLLEAGELLEQLNNELVELEQRPDDADLLNAVFRAFHTIKGGAGFTGLTALVEACHQAEDVVDRLRDGELKVNAELMDLLLKSLDVVNTQFTAARDGAELPPAPPELLSALKALADGTPTAGDASALPPAGCEAGGCVERGSDEAVVVESREVDSADAALDAMLETVQVGLDGGSAADRREEDEPPGSPASSGGDGDTIDDDEFEALLDSLHGVGGAPGAEISRDTGTVAPTGPNPPPPRDEAVPECGNRFGPAADTGETAPAPVANPAAGGMPASKSGGDSKPAARDETVRVDVGRLDQIMNLVGELVLTRNRLKSRQQDSRDPELSRITATLDRVTADVQAAVMASRLQPLQKVLSRFPRIVRDLARDLGKQVELEITGAETELDKNLVDALGEPMVHLVRNAVDHGIETPDVRAAAGKPEKGHLAITARHEGDHVTIQIAEDGAGMDPEVLRARAISKGIHTAEQAARLSDNEALQVIFAPGFSTRDEVSDVSGRGVGMDVVKNSIGQLNGSIDIDSTPGSGTRLAIKLPLTLAILSTLMVAVRGQRFALPLSCVIETYALERDDLRHVDDRPVLMVRDEPLPLYEASELLGLADKPRPDGDEGAEHVVAIEADNRTIGLIVGELLGQEEVVVKPLGSYARHLPGLAGATITGDGRIALILDVSGLLAGRPVAQPIIDTDG